MKRPVDFRKLGKLAAEAASDKKATDIVLLDVHKDSDVADCMLIAGAESGPQVRAIYESIREKLHEHGIKPIHQEGQGKDHWVALDYGGLMIHIFLSDVRAFYRLEKMWENSREIDWENGDATPRARGKKKKR